MLNKDDIVTDERFSDIQLLHYYLKGFDDLSLRQKQLVYYLSKATLCGRDITFDQFGKYNIRIRKMFEVIYTEYRGDRTKNDFLSFEIYLKRLWFSNGIYHHYGGEKFIPGFSSDYLYEIINSISKEKLPLSDSESIDSWCKDIFPVIFNPEILPQKVNKKNNSDIVVTSACNYYENVSQEEVENYYKAKKTNDSDEQPSYGLNSKLMKKDGKIFEEKWFSKGNYCTAINKIIYWLTKACDVAESNSQKEVIELLIKYYESGDLQDFDKYSIKWVGCQNDKIDFINGFIEVYSDPLGIKGSWEGIVEYKDMEATKRTHIISENAQWFEDNSPVSPCFKKKEVKGVTANVVCAAMLGGDEYPSSAIGINLPNSEWIREKYGSKSVTIDNLTDAYNKSAQNNGFKDEFIIDDDTKCLVDKYGDLCDDIHTDLHKCLGHGSGQLLPGVDPNALKAYGNTIEEARADLFALYYLADNKLIELGIIPEKNAYKSQYYTYMMNGILTQCVRIKPGGIIEEAHMRNRALIANWCYEHSQGAISIIKRNGKSYILINNYQKVRELIAILLSEIQRIKSEGDYEAAKNIVEKYAVNINPNIHMEILQRYKKLNLAPYKGFVNPVMTPLYDDNGNIKDVKVDYSESYTHQMLRYSKEYGYL